MPTLQEMQEFVNMFDSVLKEHGDMFFYSGAIGQDYGAIKQVIERQGYWSGDRLRYYFNKDYKLLRTEERRFGI